MFNIKRNYKTYLTEPLVAETIGEFPIYLGTEPDSDMWFIFIEPWTANEESIFYHRAVWNVVYAYTINRVTPKSHIDNSQVLLANSVDYLNYLLEQTPEQLFIFQKNGNHIIIKWGMFYIWWTNIEIDDLDTEDTLPNKTFISNALNYIYIYQNDFYITDEVIPQEAYLIATAFIWVSWNIDSITKFNTFIVWNKWEKGDKWDKWDTWDIGPQGIQWPQWIQGIQWPIWPQWLQGISGWFGNDGSFAYATITPTNWQTVVNLPWSYESWNNNLFVFLNWIKQKVTLDYTETSDTSITFLNWLLTTDTVEIVYPNKWLNWKWVYSWATAYLKDDAVSYNGSSYICIQNTTGNLPTNVTYWSLLTSKWDTGNTWATWAQWIQGIQGIQWIQGVQWNPWVDWISFIWQWEYSWATTYEENDVVSYNGSSYIAIDNTTGNLPTNATYWELVAAKWIDWEWAWDMLKSENLSWLTNYTTARQNLWLEIWVDVAASLWADDNYVTDAEKTAIWTIWDKAEDNEVVKLTWDQIINWLKTFTSPVLSNSVRLTELDAVQWEVHADLTVIVRAATTANITLSGTQTIDWISLVANDLVLVKNQSTWSQNGVYVVDAGAWTRATNYNTTDHFNRRYIYIISGTTNTATLWINVTRNPTVWTTATTFVQIPLGIGTAANQAAAGNHTHTSITATAASSFGAALSLRFVGVAWTRPTAATDIVCVLSWSTAWYIETMPSAVNGTNNDWRLLMYRNNATVDWTIRQASSNTLDWSSADLVLKPWESIAVISAGTNTWRSIYRNIPWQNNTGYLNIPQNSRSADYTLVLDDSGKHIYHPSADTTARTFTIPANASVAFPIGTSVTFINDTSAWAITIAITTDTLVLAWTWATWSRTLAANWIATAIKITSTRWVISGNGLT